MNPILAALALLWVAVPAVAQVWKGEVPDAAKVAALQKAAAKGDPAPTVGDAKQLTANQGFLNFLI